MAKSREELYFSNTSKTANVSTHQEIHKIVKYEILPIVKQVDARGQNFKIQFLKEAAKFVREFKSLTKEADESLAKKKDLELDIEHLLKAVVSQDIMFIVQNTTVVKTSDLQTELEYTKERFENSYNDMQQKIEWFPAQLGDLKGKSKDTPCVSDTLDPLSQKLDNENVELEFQIKNYAKENAHLKTAYKNLFDSINDTTKGASVNTQSCKQSILGKPPSSSGSKLYSVTPFPKLKGLPKIDESHALSKPVTSNSIPTPQESKVMKNENVIASGMFMIHPFKTSREDKFVPINKKDVNSDSIGLSSTGVDITTKTRRPQPRSNTKNDRVPSASKSRCIKNKEVEVEEHHRNLLLSKNKKPMSSECNNVKIMPATRSGMTPKAIEEVITQCVALETYEANQNVRNLVENEEDNRNGNRGGNSNGHGNGNRGAMQAAREGTYKKILICLPLNFKGTEGAVKYATCTLQNGALTWWNSHKRKVGTNVAYAMTWKELIKLMTKVYYLRNEIKKMESKLWNLNVKGNDLTAYTQRFQELSLLCPKMVLEEEDKIERFIWGLPDSIQGNVTSFALTRFQDAVRMASSLMDQQVRAIAARQADNKRK
ncbi:retrovirus-related pol polyprotein from transposon TNT 1-94 [Tanacetum coccineum]